jgi:hypothetical protein
MSVSDSGIYFPPMVRDVWKIVEVTHLLFLHGWLHGAKSLLTSSAIQGFPKILWNPKVHHRVYKIPLLVPILSQKNPLHSTASYFSKSHFNIIRPPTNMSSSGLFSFWLSHQNPVCILLSISSSLTWSLQLHSTESRSYEATYSLCSFLQPPITSSHFGPNTG